MLILRITINRKVYSTKEIHQMNHLKRLYEQHLHDIMGESTPFEMQDNYTPKPIPIKHTHTHSQLKGNLSLIAHAITVQLEDFLKKRKQRYFNAGYDNDPITLLCTWLEIQIYPLLQRDQCSSASIEKLCAITRFLQAIDYENVFAQEPLNARGIIALIHHLVNTLNTAIHGVSAILYTQRTREKLQKVRDAQIKIMEKTLHYLYFILSNVKDRNGVVGNHFAPINFFTTKYFKKNALKKTFSGRVFEKLIYSERVYRMLLNIHKNNTVTSSLHGQSRTLPLLHAGKYMIPIRKEKTARSTAIFHVKTLQSYLSLRKQISLIPGRRSCLVPAGIYADCDKDIPLMIAFLNLHGLAEKLAQFHHYTTVFWSLSGLGGDALILVEMGDMIEEFFWAQQRFYKCFLVQFHAFHQRVRVYYDKNITTLMSSHAWSYQHREKRQWRQHVSYSMSALNALENATTQCCMHMQNMITTIKQHKNTPQGLSTTAQSLLKALHSLPAFLRANLRNKENTLPLPHTLQCEKFIQHYHHSSYMGHSMAAITTAPTQKIHPHPSPQPTSTPVPTPRTLPVPVSVCTQLSASLPYITRIAENDYQHWKRRCWLFIGFNARYDYLLSHPLPCGKARLLSIVHQIRHVITKKINEKQREKLLADIHMEIHYVRQANQIVTGWLCRWFQAHTQQFFAALEHNLLSYITPLRTLNHLSPVPSHRISIDKKLQSSLHTSSKSQSIKAQIKQTVIP